MKKAFLLTLFALVSLGTAAKPSADFVIKHATIIDVSTGQLAPAQTLVISDGMIIERGHDEAVSEHYNTAEVIDASGKFLIPGLWDMHVHFGGGKKLINENKHLLPLYLAYGVTTVRDAAADLSESVLSWREQIKQRTLTGPTIFTSGPKLEGKDSIWPGDLEVETVEQMHAAVDKLDAMDVDFVKITDSALTPELYLKAVQEVKKRGHQISGHIPFSLSVTDVSKAGLDGIEHMTYLFKAAAKNEDEISQQVASGELSYRTALPVISKNQDLATAKAKFRVLAQNNTAVVPTLIGGQIIAHIDEENHLGDPFLDYLGAGLKETYQWRVERANKATAEQITLRKVRAKQIADLVPVAFAEGVPVIAGTDAGFLNSYIYPGLSLHQELKLFVDAGLTPLQALQTATQTGANFLQKSALYGALEKGKKADILLLDANPLADITHTQKIFAVMVNNQYHNKAALTQLKADAKKFAASTH